MADSRSTWIKDILGEVRKHIELRNYKLSKHAKERLGQRSITLPGLIFVLLNGYHEKEKTEFDTAKQSWKYAIRGKTIDGVELRIIVIFKDNMVVVTVIRPTTVKRKK